MANPHPKPSPATQFKPGVSPNPGGKPSGARNRLTGAFLNDLADHYATEGKGAIKRLCDKDPRAYVRAIIALCPKQFEATGPLDGLTDDTLQGFLAMYQAYLTAKALKANANGDGLNS